MDNCRAVSSEFVQSLCDTAPPLLALHISNCSLKRGADSAVCVGDPCTGNDVTRLFSALPTLKSLHLASLVAVDDQVMKPLVLALPGLVDLDLSFTAVSDDGIKLVASSSTALRTLSLEQCENVG